jgi:hypothetical protein
MHQSPELKCNTLCGSLLQGCDWAQAFPWLGFCFSTTDAFLPLYTDTILGGRRFLSSASQPLHFPTLWKSRVLVLRCCVSHLSQVTCLGSDLLCEGRLPGPVNLTGDDLMQMEEPVGIHKVGGPLRLRGRSVQSKRSPVSSPLGEGCAGQVGQLEQDGKSVDAMNVVSFPLDWGKSAFPPQGPLKRDGVSQTYT